MSVDKTMGEESQSNHQTNYTIPLTSSPRFNGRLHLFLETTKVTLQDSVHRDDEIHGNCDSSYHKHSHLMGNLQVFGHGDAGMAFSNSNAEFFEFFEARVARCRSISLDPPGTSTLVAQFNAS
jgi:hypothetical protein